MKKLITLIVSLVVATTSLSTAQKSNESPHASYSDDPAFKVVMRNHRIWAASPGTDLLTATWFVNGKTHVQMRHYVDRNGRTISHRFVVRSISSAAQHVNIQNNRVFHLTNKDLQSLRKAMKSVPADASTPSLNHLLILSVNIGDKKITHIYDRSRLPVEVRRVCQIIQAKAAMP